MYAIELMVMSGANDGLVITLKDNQGKGHAIEDGWEFLIGRQDGCDVMIPYDTQVSREHATLQLKPNGLWLVDLNSRNGTYCGDYKVREPVEVGLDAMIRVGYTWLRIGGVSRMNEIMPTLPPDLQALVEEESQRLNHYYLGVEHLFLALLAIDDSLTVHVLQQMDLSPDYTGFLIEDQLGKSPDRRYWRGFRPTPRYEEVIQLASSRHGGEGITQQTLLIAILEEGDSIPVRVLQTLGASLSTLQKLAETGGEVEMPTSEVEIVVKGIPILVDEIQLLSDLFPTAETITVSAALAASTQMIRKYPILVQWDADTVESMLFCAGSVETIFNSKRQFDVIQKRINEHHPQLAPLTYIKRLSNGHLGAAVYIMQHDDLVDGRTLLLQGNDLPNVLWTLREELKPIFWQKGQRYRFPLWREYEFFLPPTLVVEAGEVDDPDTIMPLMNVHASTGDAVECQDFTVKQVLPHRKRIILQAGAGTEAVYQSSVIWVENLSNDHMERIALGKAVRSITGRVIQTRDDILNSYAKALDLPFDVSQLELDTPLGTIPNPLQSVSSLLWYEVEGHMGDIHGGFSPDNIIVTRSPQLIDYSASRFGHILFDWVLMERWVWLHGFASSIPDDWDSLWEIGERLQPFITDYQQTVSLDDSILDTVTAIREIVSELLGKENDWREYFAPLALMSIAEMGNSALPLPARRWSFILACIVAKAFQTISQTTDEAL